METENQISEVSAERLIELEAIAAGLAKTHGIKKVHVYVHFDPESQKETVGYIKEPSYIQKLFAMDKIAMVGPYSAGEEMRQVLVLTGENESDPITYGAGEESDVYKLGMAGFCLAVIKVANNQFKKK